MYQIIDLQRFSSAIDQSKVSYNLSAWIGGWGDQDDAASLGLYFYNSNNITLANGTIPAVYTADRLNISELLYRQITGMVPIYTRSVKIQVDMVSATYNNDASVDDISFKLQYIP